MATPSHPNSFSARSSLSIGGRDFEIFRLDAEALGAGEVRRLPYSIKVLLENVLRHEDGLKVTAADVSALAAWGRNPTAHGAAAGDDAREIAFSPERVLLQDFTGVPTVVDLAAMRDALTRLGGDPRRINPLVPVELVVDHSVNIEFSGDAAAYDENVRVEYERNLERYQLLRWAQGSLDGFKIVPPGTGICHQVNLEYLSRLVFATPDGRAYCDTVVGTDSHTTMVNGLGVLGWGVGGIEAEAAMLGQPMSMLMPPVVGLHLSGVLPAGTTATDLVLTITELLRKHGVVGKFVEAYGPGVAAVPLATRATIGNMSPEYGATCTMFPIDRETIDYLAFTGRDDDHVALVEAYAKEQGLWHGGGEEAPIFSETVSLDLSTVVPTLAGPSRPQDRVPLKGAGAAFRKALGREPIAPAPSHEITDGAIVIAAITSCTNTSNPQVMVAAGLLARNAVERGLQAKPWVKTSLAPGSRVVMDYLERAGLVGPLEALGFFLVGFGCTTCIGNSGPLLPGISEQVSAGDLSVGAVLSGNRNFEGRIHPEVRMNYLASPPLVVAYALAGTMDIDLTVDPIGVDGDGAPVTLADIWPSDSEVAEVIASSLTREEFVRRYGQVYEGDARWKAIPVTEGETFDWLLNSTYVLCPPFFDDMGAEPSPVTDIEGARVLAIFGDSLTTDHISPAGSIRPSSPAGQYLAEHGILVTDFNSYGARRGNHEVMMRGTFANVRLRNRLAPGTEGGVTLHLPDGAEESVYDAAMHYGDDGIPLVVLGGKEYGTGSSRDWAAKGTALLGVRAVIAESFERIHRSNLIGMGVLPLQFSNGETVESLGLSGHELITVDGLVGLSANQIPKEVVARAVRDGAGGGADGGGGVTEFTCRVRIDTPMEAEYYRHGGILQYVLRQLAA